MTISKREEHILRRIVVASEMRVKETTLKTTLKKVDFL